ncbi:rRNA maturation RNase YbeY [Bacillus sp. FJAT-50079]|uniref:rRNA maturation RNase YbeY n=1 Tax=Bacillus sp. FJAT-50079 TaxID=2833577 RepID=UPI001BC99B5E|nr:rRNA maturation RNase YbeY [Bacillus sp. FJAT-50079]MBS4209073.1 rRNA maturation RNase YbeY [Bacillus sp. FJAT-50079]
MALQIDMIDETNELTEEHQQLIEKLLNYAAKEEQVEDGSELSLTFVTNEEIQEINKTYRGKDQSTDVISFAMEEMGEGEIEIIAPDMPRMLGDIIISLERAKEQADEYGHSFIREMGFLVVHGFLHLLGYDHMNEEDEKRMFSRQKTLLDGFGLER